MPINYSKHHGTSSESSRDVISRLKGLYKAKVLPIEKKYGLYNFCLPTNGEIQDAEFEARPMVLLLGQYSTGKTTFIRHIVGGDFPGMHIGPEPTTDRFMVLLNGEDDTDDTTNNPTNNNSNLIRTDANGSNKNLKRSREKDGKNPYNYGRIIKGNSLTVAPELPFSTLSTFGTGFLSHFEGSISPSPLLQHVTLIDTPGVLSGEKQRLSRSYDFAKTAKWFADRSDLILILFDAHKLDISDELKDVIETIRPHNDDKVRCILNKADGVTKEELVRVYGSLMWSMGKVFNSPEVVRVYTGSFWDEPLVNDDFIAMFEKDEGLLIHELKNLPKSSVERKVNDTVKRIRLIKVHVCILSYLKKHVPLWFGRQSAQDNLIDTLSNVFDAVRVENKLSEGDMPDVNEFAKCLREVEDFAVFPSDNKKTLRILDDLILKDIPTMMKGIGGITGTVDEIMMQKMSPPNENERNTGKQTILGSRATSDQITITARMMLKEILKKLKSIVFIICLFIIVMVLKKRGVMFGSSISQLLSHFIEAWRRILTLLQLENL